jgi:hypothetical protein
MQTKQQFNNKAVFAIFTDADKSALSFAERLMAEGIGDRATARPYAVAWAAAKHGIETKERGLTFVDKDKRKFEAAQQSAKRVLEICFPTADAPVADDSKKTKTKVDPVAREAKRILNNFTPAQRRKLIELLSA